MTPSRPDSLAGLRTGDVPVVFADRVGDRALIRGQGVTTDGEYLYFSGNFFLNKTNIQTHETVANNLLAIPPALLLKGCNHIGGIGYYDGKIYAPIEDGSAYQHPYIAIFFSFTFNRAGIRADLWFS